MADAPWQWVVRRGEERKRPLQLQEEEEEEEVVWFALAACLHTSIKFGVAVAACWWVEWKWNGGLYIY